MVIKKEEGDREIRLIASRDRLKESTQELVRSFKEIYDDNAKFDKLVYNLIRKSGMDSFYKSRVEEISNLYKFKDSLFKDENLDDFFDFLFKNYKLIYTKLQEPVSEIIKNISYKEVEVEKITKDSHDMSYMNSSGDLFTEKYSLIEIKVSDIAIEFEDSFSGLIPKSILTKFRQYLKEQVELYSKTIQVRSSVIYNDDGKLIDVNIFLKEIKEDIIESLFQDVHDEIQGILSVIELNFNPIAINYYFGIGEFILEFKDQSNDKVDPAINKEYYNKISLGRIDLDGDKKYSFIELLSNEKNKKAMSLLFEVFEKIVSQTLEELALDG